MAPATYQLIMRSGPTPGKEFPLEKDEIYVGRDVANDIVVNDPEVSRRHARLTIESGSYLVEDLGSTNGTFVNGQRLTRPHLLRPGEMLQMGENVGFAFEAQPYDADATMVGAGPVSEPPSARETYVPPSTPPPPPTRTPPPPGVKA